MARHLFNADVDPSSARAQFPVFSDQGLSTPVTDLTDRRGNAISVVTRDQDFYGPDGVTVLWGNPSNNASAPPVQYVATDVAGGSGLPAGGATGDVLTKSTAAEGDAAWAAPSGGGGSAPGAPIVRAFPFAFDAPGLVTGHSLYTPTVGDILLDAWLQIDTAWNGTTPQGDIGTFVDSTTGLVDFVIPSGAMDMTMQEDENAGTGLQIDGPMSVATILATANTDELYQTAAISSTPSVQKAFAFKASPFLSVAYRTLPAKFTVANPIKVCVSQDGSTTGADPGATQGAATLYLVTCTPATA